LYDNKILKSLVVNNDYNIYSNKIIHHFPGGPGVYQHKIDEIDDKISHIKVEKKEVNNFYTQKREEIKNADKKQIDSLLRSRYNF
jgi:hypothetical protein